jgi:hypothetical protein
MILSINADAKTSKGQKIGYMTGILYLAPHNVSGFQTCPKATDGCKASCLFTAGRGVYDTVKNARIAKTVRFFKDREGFMNDLVSDVEALIRKAKREGYMPAVRLNGTSDIAWEKIAVKRDGKDYASIMEAFPNVQFYDYTKILGRSKALILKNYHLTFSLSESNDDDAVKALAQGYNVAVVLDTKRGEAKPELWGGYPVIDGDETDVRFLDKTGHIIALHAKGSARKDTSGFVRKATAGFKKKSIEIKALAA